MKPNLLRSRPEIERADLLMSVRRAREDVCRQLSILRLLLNDQACMETKDFHELVGS